MFINKTAVKELLHRPQTFHSWEANYTIPNNYARNCHRKKTLKQFETPTHHYRVTTCYNSPTALPSARRIAAGRFHGGFKESFVELHVIAERSPDIILGSKHLQSSEKPSMSRVKSHQVPPNPKFQDGIRIKWKSIETYWKPHSIHEYPSFLFIFIFFTAKIRLPNPWPATACRVSRCALISSNGSPWGVRGTRL